MDKLLGHNVSNANAYELRYHSNNKNYPFAIKTIEHSGTKITLLPNGTKFIQKADGTTYSFDKISGKLTKWNEVDSKGTFQKFIMVPEKIKEYLKNKTFRFLTNAEYLKRNNLGKKGYWSNEIPEIIQTLMERSSFLK